VTLSKILAPMRADGHGEAVLEHAIALARPFGAHVEALYFRARRSEMLPFGVALPDSVRGDLARSVERIAEREAAHVEMMVNRLRGRDDVAFTEAGETPARDRATLVWREGAGRPGVAVSSEGRLADLVALAQPDDQTGPAADMLQAALMGTGRPVLMCPARPLIGNPLDHVAIAWNGSAQAARAVALAMPLIRAADGVSILSTGAPDGPAADELGASLALHGVAARRRDLSATGSIGGVLLEGARAAGASLLVMGAFGHSPGHEALFGGASRHVIDRAGLPVVMAH